MNKSLLYKNLFGHAPYFLLAFFSFITVALVLRGVYPAVAGLLTIFAYATLLTMPIVVLTAKNPPKHTLPPVALFLMTVWGFILTIVV